jgi:hypothetical protein
MRELLVDPEGNLLDGRDAQNVDFRNRDAARSPADSAASRFEITTTSIRLGTTSLIHCPVRRGAGSGPMARARGAFGIDGPA